MLQNGSYNVKSFSTTSEGEIRRLNAQLDLFWEKELALYMRFGLKDGMTILDAGSGPGYLSEKLLSILPSSNVTTVELDPSLVEVAQMRLLEYTNMQRCTVVNNSILKMDFPDNSFDFIVTRLVIEHVPAPEEACRELYRVLKPNGILIVVDNDFEMHVRTVPYIAELSELYEAYCEARSIEGGNPKVGRELPLLLRKTGFTNIDLEIICAHSTVIGDGPFLKSEGPGIPTQLVETGYLSSETYQKIITKWHNMLKSNDHAIIRQLYVATGRKKSSQTRTSEIIEHGKSDLSMPVINPRANVKTIPKSEYGVDDECGKIIQLITIHVAKLLGSSQVDTINDTTALTDLGIDSEMAIELQQSLSEALHTDNPLPSTLVFDYPTIRAIANFILLRMEPSMETQGNDSSNSNAMRFQKTNSEVAFESISDEDIEKKLRDKLDLLDKG